MIHFASVSISINISKIDKLIIFFQIKKVKRMCIKFIIVVILLLSVSVIGNNNFEAKSSLIVNNENIDELNYCGFPFVWPYPPYTFWIWNKPKHEISIHKVEEIMDFFRFLIKQYNYEIHFNIMDLNDYYYNLNQNEKIVTELVTIYNAVNSSVFTLNIERHNCDYVWCDKINTYRVPKRCIECDFKFTLCTLPSRSASGRSGQKDTPREFKYQFSHVSMLLLYFQQINK